MVINITCQPDYKALVEKYRHCLSSGYHDASQDVQEYVIHSFIPEEELNLVSKMVIKRITNV